MKALGFWLLIVILATIATGVYCFTALGAVEGAKGIETQKIILISPNGQHTIEMTVADDGSGLQVNSIPPPRPEPAFIDRSGSNWDELNRDRDIRVWKNANRR